MLIFLQQRFDIVDMWWIVIVIVALLVGSILLILRRMGGGRFPWIQFYVKGKESGFNIKEINLLRKVAVENRLQNPLSLFWSIKQLDSSIRGIVTKFRARGKENDEAFVAFLAKLFDFRKRVEFSLPKYKLGLKTSRKIAAHQRLKLTVETGETFESAVVENLRKYLAISYPKGPKMPPGFSWKNQKVNVYFWRPEDAGYVFQTKVLDDFIEKKYPILHVAHSDSLIRSQKRGSIRVETDRPAFLYPLRSIKSANEIPEKSQGLRSRLMDISEDGAAVLIGGRAKVGLPVKMQFTLEPKTVIMCGVVKGINYNQNKNQSILHLQAVTPSPAARNTILSYVYNLFGERDEEIKKTAAKKPIN
ncbi:MAG: PilZ domain-containing protein [Spirochaetota bacterium]